MFVVLYDLVSGQSFKAIISRCKRGNLVLNFHKISEDLKKP